MDTQEQPVAHDLALGLWSQYVDKLTVAIVAELDARGIASILLKGPVVARWLYSDGAARPYGDADLMVSPRNWRHAQATLEELGFAKELGPLDHPGMESIASEAWVRGMDNVDLHCTLWGLSASPEEAWDALSSESGELELPGRRVPTLSRAAQAVLLATHAAKHGDGWAVEDLERGMCLLDTELWSRAAMVASQLGALPAFVSGLRLVSKGPEIVQALGLPTDGLPEAELRAWRVPLALGIEQLANTSGLFNKVQVLARELLPTPAFLRWWTPIARRGPLGLAAAYIWRILWISRHAVPAIKAWRHVHRPALGRYPQRRDRGDPTGA